MDFTLSWTKHLHVIIVQIRYSVVICKREQEHSANVDHFHAVEQPVYRFILCRISQAQWGDGRQPKIWKQPGWPKSGEVRTQTDNWRLPRAQEAQCPFKQQWLGVFLFNLTLPGEKKKKIPVRSPQKVSKNKFVTVCCQRHFQDIIHPQQFVLSVHFLTLSASNICNLNALRHFIQIPCGADESNLRRTVSGMCLFAWLPLFSCLFLYTEQSGRLWHRQWFCTGSEL